MSVVLVRQFIDSNIIIIKQCKLSQIGDKSGDVWNVQGKENLQSWITYQTFISIQDDVADLETVRNTIHRSLDRV